MAVGRGGTAAILAAGAVGAAIAALLLSPGGQARREAALHVGDETRGALKDVTAGALAALAGEATAAAAVPQLRAALDGRFDAYSLEDLFQTEDWWMPYRSRGLALVGPGGPFVTRNAPGPGLGTGEIVARAAPGQTATGFARVGGHPLLQAAAIVTLREPPPRVLVLARPVDEALMADWAKALRGGLCLSDGHAVLLSPTGDGAVRPDALVGHEGDAPVVDPAGAWVAASLPLSSGLWLWGVRALPVETAPTRGHLLWGLCGVLGVATLAVAARRRPAAAMLQPATSSSSGAPPVTPPPAQRPSNLHTQIAGGEPKVFGRYTVIDRLGEGGMCDIYTAALTGPEGFQRTFVLKRLKPEISRNRAAIDQFIDEAKLGSTLVHNNIVPVFDFGRVGDGYFIAQEYIVGRNVRQLIARHLERLREPLDLGTVFYIAYETLQALAYAHDKCDEAGEPLRIVHRDVSPGNVIVSAGGEVKLIDFGIVKAEGRVSHTDLGNVKGNAAFMSPEQARGQPVDARSDLFSLAVVAYGALTGEAFYQGGTTAEVFYAAASGPTAEHHARLGQLPPVAARILGKALAADPADRYASADEFAADLIAHVPAGAKASLATLLHALFGPELRPSSGGGGGASGIRGTSGLRRGAG